MCLSMYSGYEMVTLDHTGYIISVCLSSLHLSRLFVTCSWTTRSVCVMWRSSVASCWRRWIAERQSCWGGWTGWRRTRDNWNEL